MEILDKSLSNEDKEYLSSHPNLNGLGKNLTNSNKWFAYFPIESILGPKYNGLELHLTKFSLPQMEMSSTEVSYKGYTKAIPTKVMNSATKELTLEFLVDAEWQNYKCLYLWMNSIEGSITSCGTETVDPISPSDYIPLRIYLLDNYKNKVI